VTFCWPLPDTRHCRQYSVDVLLSKELFPIACSLQNAAEHQAGMSGLGGSDGSQETFELDRRGEFYNERFAGFRPDLHLWRASRIALTLGQSKNFLALILGNIWPVGSYWIGNLSSRLLLRARLPVLLGQGLASRYYRVCAGSAAFGPIWAALDPNAAKSCPTDLSSLFDPVARPTTSRRSPSLAPIARTMNPPL
jgi:hypothetical protein